MDRLRRIDPILEELAKGPGMVGAALVSRDGLPVRSTGRAALARETFHAMAATAAGALEIALAEVDGGKPTSVVVSSDRYALALVGVSHELVLLVLAEANAPRDPLVALATAAAAKIALAAAGG